MKTEKALIYDLRTTTTGSRNLSNQNIFVSFFSNEGSFSQLLLLDSLDSRIESNFIELCLAVRITFLY